MSFCEVEPSGPNSLSCNLNMGRPIKGEKVTVMLGKVLFSLTDVSNGTAIAIKRSTPQ